MKICSKCKIEKELSEFSKRKRNKDGLRNHCKKCINIYSKLYRQDNKEKIARNNKKYRKKYAKSKVNYKTYALQISWAKDPVRNVNGFLQTRCTYCGKWYFPILRTIQNRIKALNGQGSDGTESRLYCSTECKQECPIYRKRLYQEGHPKKNENNYNRESQPELRQMVFERDEHTCIKCGKHQDELTVPLHCHHIEGIHHNPIESADIDMCVTVCKTCHKEIHQEDGCGYNDMRCKNKININSVKGE